MTDAPDMIEEPAVENAVTRRRHYRWPRRLFLAGLAFVVLAVAALAALDTQIGHRFIARQIAAQQPSSGLRIEIGRIDGSIWRQMTLREIRLSDPKGRFLTISAAEVAWQPLAWFNNRLQINRLIIPDLALDRLPKLKPSAKKGPLLPSFDIIARDIRIQRARIGAAITGKPQIARLEGALTARQGELRVELDANSTAMDVARIRVEAVPDDNRFDANVRIDAPAGGVIGPLLGTKRAFSARVEGEGDWQHWRGAVHAQMEKVELIDLALANNEGRFDLNGTLAPSRFLSGKLMRLSAPTIDVAGTAQLENRKLRGAISLKSAALDLRAQGVLDLARNRFEQVELRANLLKAPALFPNMTGRKIALVARVDGAFATASFDYLLTAPFVAFDTTGFENVRITGKGHLSASPVLLPVNMTASRVTGAGDVVGGILQNLSVNGVVKVTPKLLTGEKLALRSDKLNGDLALVIDLVTGKFDVSINAGMKQYLIPGLGLVDVMTELTVVPGPDGKGSQVGGRGRAWIRRFDNSFLHSLAGGLPVIDTRLARGRDGIIHFIDLKLTAPTLTMHGTGFRRRDGTFFFEGKGVQGQYGAFDIVLDGRIDRPRLDLMFASPNPPLRIRQMRLVLDPSTAGYDWRAEGQSMFGPFQGQGQILMAPGTETRIAVAQLRVSGTNMGGVLTSRTGGFDGRLDLNGGGISGQLTFSPVDGVQQIKARLRLRNATVQGATPIIVRAAQIDGSILLDPMGTNINATIGATGIQRGPISLARFAGNFALQGGSGTIKSSFAGARGRSFEIQSVAEITPDRWQIAAQGSVDRKPIRLVDAAVLTRTDDGWQLAPTALEFAGGRARVSGLFGDGRVSVDADLQRLPLTIADILQPQLGLGGIATGRLHYVHPGKGRGTPQADLYLKIKGLTRSGLILSSRPVDAGVNIALRDNAMSARALIATQDGKVIGRAQGRIAPLGGQGSLMDRLAAAPLFAQLRYDGAADTLWRMIGVETIDLSGPVAIGADVTGTAANPIIRGSMRSTKMRLESAVTGAVIDNISATGRFNGSRLIINQFAGGMKRGGKVAGRATFDISAERGVGMDIHADLKNAELVDRDDLGATVSGPLTITSDGSTGVIGGKLVLERSRYRLGRAAASSIPTINVREVNGEARGGATNSAGPHTVWRYDLDAKARNQMMVTGLGLDSEWQANLHIGGAVLNPEIVGSASLVRGGYEFAGRRFDLDRGEIRFTGDAPPDPVLDISALANVSGLNATIRVTGTGLRPDISFTSIPALPEDELLARLLFGTSITNLSAPEAVQLAAAVAALNSPGGGLNPINFVRKATGLDRLRILPADVATGIGTSVAAGKYIGRRTYVEVISDGAGYSATRVEFQITRWLSLLSSVSTIGRQSVNVRVSKDY